MADVFMIDAVPGEEIVDIQFAVNTVREKLPGWIWKICSCCVSDDAWVVPDFNDPAHGARLHAEFDPVVFDSHFDSGFDVDRRPPGNPGRALLDALDLALAALAKREQANKITSFAKAILHGDDEHQRWLTEAAAAFNEGEPLPPPRGGGVKKLEADWHQIGPMPTDPELEEKLARIKHDGCEVGD
jgi:hypothetical protein